MNDFLQLAGKVREAATEQSKGLWVGIFYDPVAWEFPLEDLLSRKDKMFRRVKTWPGCDEDSERFLEELIKKRRAESRKDRLGMSRKMLRRQVRGFAKWLKEQGAI